MTTAATPTPTPTLNTTTTTTTTTTASTDPKVIADEAVAAMKVVMDTVKAQLPTLTPSPKTTKSPELRARKGGRD